MTQPPDMRALINEGVERLRAEHQASLSLEAQQQAEHEASIRRGQEQRAQLATLQQVVAGIVYGMTRETTDILTAEGKLPNLKVSNTTPIPESPSERWWRSLRQANHQSEPPEQILRSYAMPLLQGALTEIEDVREDSGDGYVTRKQPVCRLQYLLGVGDGGILFNLRDANYSELYRGAFAYNAGLWLAKDKALIEQVAPVELLDTSLSPTEQPLVLCYKSHLIDMAASIITANAIPDPITIEIGLEGARILPKDTGILSRTHSVDIRMES